MTAQSPITELAAQVAGPVLVPGDPGYADECATFNLLTPLTPAIVVGATSVEDVQAAIRFAAAEGLAVATRSGGHLQPRTAEGALLITMDRMRSVTVDEENATARVTGAARWQEVLDVTTPLGLAPMNGSSPTVGVIGYLLGGGMSPVLGRPYGYASDHVTRFEMVTADGEFRTVTITEEMDLFIALRGSKGNFGVVTAVEFGLFPITTVYAGGLWFPGEHMALILPAWRDLARRLPESTTTSVAIQRLPPLPELPEPLRGAFVVHVRFAHLGDPDEGAALIAPLRALAPTVFDTLNEIKYADSSTIHADPLFPLPYVDRSLGLQELSDDTLAALIDVTGPESDCPLISVEVRALGGALDRAPYIPDSVPSRGVPFQWFAFGVGGPDEAPAMRAYLEHCVKALTPWAHDHKMVNFVSPDEGLTPQELSEVYGDALYDRLLAAKRKYDPANMFRMNHNLAAH